MTNAGHFRPANAHKPTTRTATHPATTARDAPVAVEERPEVDLMKSPRRAGISTAKMKRAADRRCVGRCKRPEHDYRRGDERYVTKLFHSVFL